VTVVAFASLKGAPGVTTTTCLVAATWPTDRRVVVVEADPAGGDLAARFSLSAARGWPTFLTAARRTAAGAGTGPSARVEPHLQSLPGGLQVLVGARASVSDPPEWSASAVVAGCADAGAGGMDVLVDLGRLHLPAPGPGSWLDLADLVAVTVSGDAASVLRLQEVRDQLVAWCGPRLVVWW